MSYRELEEQQDRAELEKWLSCLALILMGIFLIGLAMVGVAGIFELINFLMIK